MRGTRCWIANEDGHTGPAIVHGSSAVHSTKLYSVIETTVQRPIRILHLKHHPDVAKFAQLKLHAQGVACDLLRIL